MDASQFNPSNFNSSNETPKEGKQIFIEKHFAIFQTNLNWKNKKQKQTRIEDQSR